LLTDISVLLLNPVFFVPFALVALVLWIIHWSSVVRSRHELERNARLHHSGPVPDRISDTSSAQQGSFDASTARGNGATPRPKPRSSTGTIVGVVLGVLGLVVVVGGVVLVLSLASNSGNRLKAVSLETDGLFVPDVVAVLHNTGRGGYFRFFVEAGGSRICNGGKTFIAEGERRTIRFSCPPLSDHSKFQLRWVSTRS